MNWLKNVETQIETDARDADATAGVVVLDNPAGMTVSLRAALGARSGEWRWCLFCRLLDVLVQRGHCEATLDPNAPVPWWVYSRAAVAFLAATLLALAALHWLVLLAIAVL
jgi:hypothetical protein